MSKPLEGVRVLEVAAWTFVPAAGAILADLGAEVIKVEPPTGDPQRGLKNMLNLSADGPNPFNEIPNRGKKSITIDLSKPAGREVLLKIAAVSDVFLTSNLPAIRQKMHTDIDDIRAVNPNIIYVCGSGWGVEGPMKNTGGYDLACAWASSGFAARMAQSSPTGTPPPQPPAFYDLQGGNTIAGAIAMALFKRERTGETSVVDVSLLNVAMWSMAPDIVSAPYVAGITLPDRQHPGNPVTNWYRTKDQRWIYFVLLQADRFWGELCDVMQRPDLKSDPKFENATVRFQHKEECVAVLDAIFAEHTLEEWKTRLANFTGVWAPVIDVKEVHDHVQVGPNGYLPMITGNDGNEFRLVAAPYRFDNHDTTPAGPAPELGQDTEMILMDAGLDWDQISAYRDAGALG
ncbi:MAG: CoA transferase [Actinomycetota bacterium]|nr:CoA transferase [Actinomycetota bacterium]